MGCDIHLYVEKKVNGVWKSADQWEPSEYADEGETRLEVPYRKRFYSGRNYDLFGILADVRNGRGFAGIDTGDGFVPIDDPRGLPDDVSPEVKADSDRWDSDGHSHSWLTVAELLAYDWTQTTKVRGVLTAVEYWRWNKFARERGESPSGWSGNVWGGDVQKLSEPELQELLKPYGTDWSAEERIKKELANVYCPCEWEQPYYKTVRDFWGNTMPRLLHLGKPDDVRIVFFFDN